MKWGDCLETHVVEIKVNKEIAESLLNMASLRYEFWSKIKLDSKYSSLAVEGIYESIKELLTALLYCNGFKSDNHECLIAFLKHNYPCLSYEIGIIYQLKDLRNEIDYKGQIVSPEYLERNRLEFKHIFDVLSKAVKANF